MPISDLVCIQAINDLYNQKGNFDHIFDGTGTDGVYCGIKYINGNTLVVYRGSITFEDWAKDFFTIPHEIISHPKLGDLHAGFALGSTKMIDKIIPLIRGEVILTGHSLGAAQAPIGAGLLVDAGIIPKAVITFAAPKPGYIQLANLLEPIKEIREYVNMNDLVTHVPFTLIAFSFTHIRYPAIQLNVPTTKDDPWGVLGEHHHELYLEGTSKLSNIPIITN